MCLQYSPLNHQTVYTSADDVQGGRYSSRKRHWGPLWILSGSGYITNTFSRHCFSFKNVLEIMVSFALSHYLREGVFVLPSLHRFLR